LLYDLDSYSYRRTVKPSDGYPLQDMQLLGEKGAIVYKRKDSLFYLDYNSPKTLGKSSFTGTIGNQSNSRYKIFTNPVDYYHHVLLVLNLTRNINVQLMTKQKVVSAYITGDNNHIIYIEQKQYPTEQNIVCVNLSNKSIVWEKPLESKHKIIQIFNATGNTKIEAVAFSEEDDEMAVFSYDSGAPSAKLTPLMHNSKVGYYYPFK
jgi:hypothetical protein